MSTRGTRRLPQAVADNRLSHVISAFPYCITKRSLGLFGCWSPFFRVCSHPMKERKLLTWCDDLHLVRGNMSQLLATLALTLQKTPSPVEYNNLCLALGISPKAPAVQQAPSAPKAIEDRVRNLVQSPQLKAALHLRHLFDTGGTPALKLLALINFKSPSSASSLAKFLEYAPKSHESLGIEALAHSGDARVSDNRASDKYALEKSIDPSKYPPTLPPISDPLLLIRAFTDKSYLSCAELLSQSACNRHNSKMSIRGRAIIDLILYALFDEKLSACDESQIFLLRARLTSDAFFAKIALGYSMPAQSRHQISVNLSAKVKLRIFANLFVSYVCALQMDGYSYSAISRWISELYDPIILEASVPGVRPNYYGAELSLMCKTTDPNHKRLVYVQLERNPYVSRVYLDDFALGTGTSSRSLAEAESRAAASTLESEEYLQLLSQELCHQGMLQCSKGMMKYDGNQEGDDEEAPQDRHNYNDYEQETAYTDDHDVDNYANGMQNYDGPSNNIESSRHENPHNANHLSHEQHDAAAHDTNEQYEDDYYEPQLNENHWNSEADNDRREYDKAPHKKQKLDRKFVPSPPYPKISKQNVAHQRGSPTPSDQTGTAHDYEPSSHNTNWGEHRNEQSSANVHGETQTGKSASPLETIGALSAESAPLNRFPRKVMKHAQRDLDRLMREYLYPMHHTATPTKDGYLTEIFVGNTVIGSALHRYSVTSKNLASAHALAALTPEGNHLLLNGRMLCGSQNRAKFVQDSADSPKISGMPLDRADGTESSTEPVNSTPTSDANWQKSPQLSASPSPQIPHTASDANPYDTSPDSYGNNPGHAIAEVCQDQEMTVSVTQSREHSEERNLYVPACSILEPNDSIQESQERALVSNQTMSESYEMTPEYKENTVDSIQDHTQNSTGTEKVFAPSHVSTQHPQDLNDHSAPRPVAQVEKADEGLAQIPAHKFDDQDPTAATEVYLIE